MRRPSVFRSHLFTAMCYAAASMNWTNRHCRLRGPGIGWRPVALLRAMSGCVRPSLSAILDGENERGLPDKVNGLIANRTLEIMNLRPTMNYGLSRAVVHSVW
jgi:hypothetical protein